MLEYTAQKAEPAYQIIQHKVQCSQVIGGDEPGASFGVKKGWFHVWQTN